MYKILLADDEALEREAIRYMLQNGFMEPFDILECNNGKDALRMMMEERPDLTILDIQMPGMTGLEVLERIRAMGFQKKVLFLTAFDSFDYAVTAIKLQAQDFIIKPVSEHEFKETIDRVVDELDSEAIDQEMAQKKDALLENMEKAFLKKMVMGEIDDEVMAFMNIQGISYDASGNCICFKLLDDVSEIQSQNLQNALKERIHALQYFAISNLQNKMLTLVYFAGGELLVDDTELIRSILVRTLQNHKTRFMLGCGEGFEDLGGVEECYDAAREQIGDIQPVKKDQKAKKAGVDSDKSHIAESSARIESTDMVSENTENHGMETMDKREKDIPQELYRVRDYMNEHYAQKVTLEELAKVAGFTKCYLSRIFKRYFEENIMDYIMRIRMEKAKELLAEGELSVKQIGSMVGFMEPNYFTWTFKKLVGETPLKYRNSNKKEKVPKEEWNF